MNKESNTINESKMIVSQQKAWTKHHHLYLINKGSVWRAFYESAYVLSALLHYKLTRRMKKKDTTFVDSVTFRTDCLEIVLAKVCAEGGEIVERAERIIIYRWNKDVEMPDEFSIVRGKNIPKNLRFDEETNSALKKITSNGGFGGREKATDSEIIRYAIKHFYDNKPVDLKEAGPLIKAISENRKPLQEGLYILTKMVKELNAIGNNINQIAHNINYLMLKATEDNVDVGSQITQINSFYYEVNGALTKLMELTDRLEPSIEPAKVAVLTSMDKENEIMNRLLI